MADLSDSLRDAVFYGILDTGYVARENMYEKCRQLIMSGAKIVQLRAKKESEETRRELAFEMLPLFKKKNAPYFIINDSPELAAEICGIIPNAGLHVGQDDMPPHEARKLIGKKRVLGLSTHSPEQAKNADGLSDILDYFAVGPVYATQTKPGRIPVGLQLVEYAAKMNFKLPWFAIGGINMKTAQDVRKAGAQRIVAVSDVLLPKDTCAAVGELTKKFLGA
jgi:thiamine-phosphate diphosphorylase